MTSISSATSAANPYQATDLNSFVQFVNDFNGIGNGLRNGDLSATQKALDTFQQNLPGSSEKNATQPFGNNKQANSDYQDLTNFVHAGDLNGAKAAYTNLQNDLEGGMRTRRRHYNSSGAMVTKTADAGSTSNVAPETADSLLDALA